MNIKLLTSLLFAFFPLFAFADSNGSGSLSFAPPPGDFSVVFLGNIFGIVDGVLHGSGSQIMGSMFGVFNAAVLALGGIIIMYTLLVSTLNTAHEGEVLGKQWSSIWIPMRSTLGLALLIPKASGYCMMQIFVMWVVVQGVGAADKVWDAALSYLNRGGVIIQAQQNPLAQLTGGNNEVALGGSYILSGEVCMAGLQKALESQKDSYLKLKSGGSGPCVGNGAATNPLCNSPVPDLIASVNVVSIQNDAPLNKTWAVDFPNLEQGNPYQALNGVCGRLTWSAISTTQGRSLKQMLEDPGYKIRLSENEVETAELSRAIALQQMYLDLSTMARVIVNNNPVLNPPSTSGGVTPVENAPFVAQFAQQQFGVPYTASGQPCTTTEDCITWGNASSAGNTNKSSPLFSGSEFQGAMLDYSGIMMPTLNLIEQSKHDNLAVEQRAFITQAQNSGWIMAGSYFFNLVQLSASNPAGPNATDHDTGIKSSTFNKLSTTYDNTGCAMVGYGVICQWLGDNATAVSLLNSISSMIDGGVSDSPTTPLNGATVVPSFQKGAVQHGVYNGPASATVYGLVNNALMLQTPGQPGMSAPKFAMDVNIDFSSSAFKLPKMNFGCGNVKTFLFSFCLGGLLGDIFYNLIMVNVFNYFLTYVASVINGVVMIFLIVPLQGIAGLFQIGIAAIQDPKVNPVVALAAMGINYINLSNQMWIYLLGMAITTSLIPYFGIFIFALLAMVLPLLIAWLGTMTAIGFVTAYYIPVLPYMIFTFGAMTWLITVIEAMVAAPIVALGVTHPEGHEAFGKGESAIMILMNVFLRPAMMIIGYIAAIALSFVSVWLINAGFATAMNFLGDTTVSGGTSYDWGSNLAKGAKPVDYTNWASVYAFFFSVLIYTTMYLTAVTKSFMLITYLPDKVLRWIGGQPESIGTESSQWAEEGKQKVEKAGGDTMKASQQMQSQLSGAAQKAIGPSAGGSSAEASGGKGGGKDGGKDGGKGAEAGGDAGAKEAAKMAGG